mgnify:CR=1 FL=1
MSQSPIVIAAARRTPIGAFQGALSAVTAPELAAAAMQTALGDAGIEPAEVSEAISGCVLPAGLEYVSHGFVEGPVGGLLDQPYGGWADIQTLLTSGVIGPGGSTAVPT